MQPKKRVEGIHCQQLGEDTLLMDEQTSHVHCLNRVAYLVYECADGETTPEQIAARLSDEHGIPCTIEAVEVALEQLVEKKLIEAAIVTRSPEQLLLRRDVLKKLATMAAVPVIMSMAAQTAQATLFCTRTFLYFTPSGAAVYRRTC